MTLSFQYISQFKAKKVWKQLFDMTWLKKCTWTPISNNRRQVLLPFWNHVATQLGSSLWLFLKIKIYLAYLDSLQNISIIQRSQTRGPPQVLVSRVGKMQICDKNSLLLGCFQHFRTIAPQIKTSLKCASSLYFVRYNVCFLIKITKWLNSKSNKF